MHRFHRALAVIPAAALMLTISGTACSQSREIWIGGGLSGFRIPYSHSNRDLGSPEAAGNPNDVQIDNGWRVGLRLGFNTSGSFGHEFQYAYNRPGPTDSTGTVLVASGPPRMELHQVGYNFLYYFTSRETALRPLATAGVQIDDFALRGTDLSAKYAAKFGFNYGVGLKFRMTPLFGWRVDLRGYETGKPDWGGLLVHQSGLIHQAETSAGFGVFF
jgi:hypothetical protein